MHRELKFRRVLLSVSDKSGVVELARAFAQSGAELVATGRTAKVLEEAGLSIVPIEKISGSPEAFQGRMKTLSFPVCSGILYRRGDSKEAQKDQQDLQELQIKPIDAVIVNFYPFEEAVSREGISRKELIDEVDIGGPTLVRAAAKNAPDVLVLTDPRQYSQVIEELDTHGTVSHATAIACAETAWERVLNYDAAIARELGGRGRLSLRYGENPHQKGSLEFDPDGPIAWPRGREESLTSAELSYNNILDVSAAYGLASDLLELARHSIGPATEGASAGPIGLAAGMKTAMGTEVATGVVIVKHNNPCGVALVPISSEYSHKDKRDSRESGGSGVSKEAQKAALKKAQKMALLRAWEGDPVSAFGGVLVFTHPIEDETAEWLSQHFVELVAAPGLSKESPVLKIILGKRKNLKALNIRRFGELPQESMISVPGGRVYQTTDLGTGEGLKSVTRVSWPKDKERLAQFGISVCRALKSNAIALVREIHQVPGAYQLVGAGQGQPNRVEALKSLAIPRAQSVLRASEGSIEDCVMISDAFFPFRDTVDTAHAAGVRFIIQPGGSIKDAESIAACDENGMAMAFTGVRHFRH